MFSGLSDKLQGAFTKLFGPKKLTEDNIQEAIGDVRLALLDADVQYGVVRDFIKGVKERSVGADLFKAVSPGQQFVKIVHDEMIHLLGGEEVSFALNKKPSVVMLCGLQGSGKTTAAAKFAKFAKEKLGVKSPCLVACDLARPAAIEQLRVLSEQVGAHFYTLPQAPSAVAVAREVMRQSENAPWDLIILDTAGRLAIDESLMSELSQIREISNPSEVFFVANASMGQDAIKTASAFSEKVGVTGNILTMLDGSARAGAALSIVKVTGKPIFFEGIGEKVADFRPFHPASLADRILGMGDTINLVRQAQEHIKEEDAQELEKKLRKASFTYEDFLKQMQMVKKMGSLKSLLGMIPGMSKLKELDFDEKEFFKTEAIILSMTNQERTEGCELSVSRRRRIAKGSGTSIDDINKLVKSFKQAKQLFKNMPSPKQLEKLIGGKQIWR